MRLFAALPLLLTISNDARAFPLDPHCIQSSKRQIIIVYGQSRASGSGGYSPVSLTQQYENERIRWRQSVGHIEPLIENRNRNGDGRRPHVETIASGLANQLAMLSGRHGWLMIAIGKSGAPYSELMRGTAPYVAVVGLVQEAQSLINGGVEVATVVFLHQEKDTILNTPNYADLMIQLQSDLDTDLRSITGQSRPIPLVLDQSSAWTGTRSRPEYERSTSGVVGEVQRAADSSEHIYVTTAGYHLPYSDSVGHHTAEGYRRLGEIHGAAIYRRQILCRLWFPLKAVRAHALGSSIAISFHTPSPPLVFDVANVMGEPNLGFEWPECGVNIVGLEIVGTSVVLHLDGPVPSGGVVNYAWTGIPGAGIGPMIPGAVHGNLRDSDSMPSQSFPGQPLHNWALHFSIPYTGGT